jgi:phospholipid/cholesterol/gamma-HCH transport system ATP-binding protein
MFGPREVLLTSEEPVVKQFLNGRREGPIGMSEEKDAGQVAAELASLSEDEQRAPGTGPKGATSGGGVPPQLQPSPGLPERKAAGRRQQRVLELLHTLPSAAQQAIRESLPDGAEAPADAARYDPDPAAPTPEANGADWSAATRHPGQPTADIPAGQPVGADRTSERSVE